MQSNEDLGAKVAQLEALAMRLAAADQLSSSSVGDNDTDLAEAVDAATDAADALPQLQDDLDEHGEAVSDLATQIDAQMADLDAQLELAATNLDVAREEIEEAQAAINVAFGTRVDGISDDVETAIVAAGSAKTEAEAATDAARDAAGLAASKGETIYQVSAPTGSRASTANLWIDITPDANGVPKNTPNRYVEYSKIIDPAGVAQIATRDTISQERIVDGMTLTGLTAGLRLAVNVGLYVSMALNGLQKQTIARIRDGGVDGPILGSYVFTDHGDSTTGDAERWDFGGYVTPTTSTLVVTIQVDLSATVNNPDVYASRRLIAGSGTGWVPITDQKALDAATAAATASAAAQAAKDVATQANAAASVAQQTATDANTAALTAAGIANAKGKVIRQQSKPTGANAAVGNLWIRSSDNTPWVFDATASDWVQVTDQVAIDAAANAAKAQQDATAASNAAKAAQATADSKPLILYSSTAGPSGTAPNGTIWFLWDSAKNVAGQWLQSGTLAAPVWTPQQIRSEVIANLDVAKLTAGSAAIAELVAQKIAAATGNFQTVNVSNLFVTSGATMSQAVIDYLFANVVQAKKITAGMIDVDSLNGITLTGALIKTAASGARIEMLQRRIDVYDSTGTRAGAISAAVVNDSLSLFIGALDASGTPIAASGIAFNGGSLRAPSTISSTNQYTKLSRLGDVDCNGYYGFGGLNATRQGSGFVTAERFRLNLAPEAGGNNYQTVVSKEAEGVVVTADVVNAGQLRDSSTGQSPLPLTGTSTYPGTLAANSSDTLTVAFPSGRFTKPPLVNANGSNSRVTIGINSVTKDAVTFALGNWTSGASGAPIIYYTATPRP
ncbi:hypothetical protein [Curtobacterium sp. VKM Ac-2884]|uniref:hypothetical protein n=1 Tax=Curtobacterium sp. VKM Ac-2884 TaxID=2783818 RepID=UPI00188BF38C|nr:hypothetical protein [Curtobacterium sp. VKM Ac-2884]MBF4602842.1 hypothetical protein [Curtobacterium sp. VKM Ac-2884]